MTTTNHPLTETAAAELWEAHIPERKTEYLGWQSFPEPSRRCFTTILRAAYDAGREHEREHAAPRHDPRPWQDCTRDDIRKGDLVEALADDILHIGVARHQDEGGDWWTKDNYPLTYIDHRPLRRIPAPTPPAEEVELPDERPAHITDVGHVSGGWATYMALDRDGFWTGVDGGGSACAWEGDDLTAFTLPDGTRARSDGYHKDGTPRFVKVTHNDCP